MDKWEIIDHTFKFRVGDSEEAGGCTLIGGEWKDVTTTDLFKDKKVVLFSLPGAFTPTCSGQELPSYDSMHQQFKDKGIDAVYCISVNDFLLNSDVNIVISILLTPSTQLPGGIVCSIPAVKPIFFLPSG